MKLKFMCCPKDSCARCTVAGSGAYLDSRLACGAVLGLGSYIDRKGTQVSCACVQHYPRIQSSWIRASALVNILICRNALKLPRVWTGSIVNKLGRIPSLVFPPCAAPRARCEASRVGPEELSGKSVRVVCVCARARAPTRARPVPSIFLHQSLSALTHGSRCTFFARESALSVSPMDPEPHWHCIAAGAVIHEIDPHWHCMRLIACGWCSRITARRQRLVTQRHNNRLRTQP
jgi:hypothetical protein